MTNRSRKLTSLVGVTMASSILLGLAPNISAVSANTVGSVGTVTDGKTVADAKQNNNYDGGGNDAITKAGDITVYYVDDATGENITDPLVLKGSEHKIGDGYTTGIGNLEDSHYKLITTPKNATGFFTDKPQSVTYRFASTKEEALITVRMLTKDGKNLMPEQTFRGTVGVPMDITIPDLSTGAGFYKDFTVENAVKKDDRTYTVTPKGDTVVTFTFKDTDIPVAEQGTVMVYYKLVDGTIIGQGSLTGTVGDTYETTPLAELDTPTGYVLKETPANAKGKITKDLTTVTYIYEDKRVNLEHKLQYVDEETGEVLHTVTAKGKQGDWYKFTQNLSGFTGYEVSYIDGNLEGTFRDGDDVTKIMLKKVGTNQTHPEQNGNEIKKFNIHYVDEGGTELKPTETVEYRDDIKYDLEGAPEIDNYFVVRMDKSIANGVADITFTYKKATANNLEDGKHTIEFSYYDTAGNQIKTAEKVKFTGQSYGLSNAPKIAGYVVKSYSVSSDVDGNLAVSYVYVPTSTNGGDNGESSQPEAADKIKRTYQYRTTNGFKLGVDAPEDETVTEDKGSTLKTAKQVAGYTYQETKIDRASNGDEVITFVFTKNADGEGEIVADGSYDVTYLDTTGKEIAKKVILTPTESKDKDRVNGAKNFVPVGYRFKSSKTEIDVDGNTHVVNIYEKDEVKPDENTGNGGKDENTKPDKPNTGDTDLPGVDVNGGDHSGNGTIGGGNTNTDKPNGNGTVGGNTNTEKPNGNTNTDKPSGNTNTESNGTTNNEVKPDENKGNTDATTDSKENAVDKDVVNGNKLPRELPKTGEQLAKNSIVGVIIVAVLGVLAFFGYKTTHKTTTKEDSNVADETKTDDK